MFPVGITYLLPWICWFNLCNSDQFVESNLLEFILLLPEKTIQPFHISFSVAIWRCLHREVEAGIGIHLDCQLICHDKSRLHEQGNTNIDEYQRRHIPNLIACCDRGRTPIHTIAGTTKNVYELFLIPSNCTVNFWGKVEPLSCSRFL